MGLFKSSTSISPSETSTATVEQATSNPRYHISRRDDKHYDITSSSSAGDAARYTFYHNSAFSTSKRQNTLHIGPSADSAPVAAARVPHLSSVFQIAAGADLGINGESVDGREWEDVINDARVKGHVFCVPVPASLKAEYGQLEKEADMGMEREVEHPSSAKRRVAWVQGTDTESGLGEPKVNGLSPVQVHKLTGLKLVDVETGRPLAVYVNERLLRNNAEATLEWIEVVPQEQEWMALLVLCVVNEKMRGGIMFSRSK